MFDVCNSWARPYALKFQACSLRTSEESVWLKNTPWVNGPEMVVIACESAKMTRGNADLSLYSMNASMIKYIQILV